MGAPPWLLPLKREALRIQLLPPKRSLDGAPGICISAREGSNWQNEGVVKGADRKGLMEDPVFKAAFMAAKARIRNMDYRFVEETDQNTQALLEIYCAVVLSTPYNDFKTH